MATQTRDDVRCYVLFEESGANPDHLLKGNESLPVVWRHSAEYYPARRAFAVDLDDVAFFDPAFGCLNLEDEVTQAAPPFELRRLRQRQNVLRLVRGERVHVDWKGIAEDQIQISSMSFTEASPGGAELGIQGIDGKESSAGLAGPGSTCPPPTTLALAPGHP